MHQEPHFPLVPPPRPVPFLLRAQVLFGGVLNFIGWFFFGFGLIFVLIFGSLADLSSWYRFRGEVETARGTITAVEETSSSENKTRIYAYRYSFRTPNGEEHKGVSYRTGRSHEPSEEIIVEYLPDEPSYSRIQGMRRAEFSPWVLFVVIFPLVGFIFVLVVGWAFFSARLKSCPPFQLCVFVASRG